MKIGRRRQAEIIEGIFRRASQSVIAGIPTNDSSYETAVNLLKSRYADPAVIQRTHINQLLNLAPVFNEKNTSRLRSLHDHIETQFRGLQALGVDKITYSSVIVRVLIEKIPGGIWLGMLRDVRKSHLGWNLEEMLGALSKELEIRVSRSIVKKCQWPGKTRRYEKIKRGSQLYCQGIISSPI
eukprot:gene15469-biopygen12872